MALTLWAARSPRWLGSLAITAAIAVFILWPALLDLWPAAAPVRQWASGHEFAFQALAALINLLVLATLLRVWQDRAAKRRFASMEKIAMRSLSQAVNDVGRRIMGPIAGIDLQAAGIPGQSHGDQSDWQNWLVELGPYRPQSGFWTDLSAAEIDSRVTALSHWPDFPARMFKHVAFARRELQSALAQWAAVVVLVPGAEARLASTWELYDSVVDLAEEWRGAVGSQTTPERWDRLRDRMAMFNSQYLLVLHSLQPYAKLPTQGPRGEDGKPFEAYDGATLARLHQEFDSRQQKFGDPTR